MFPCFQNRVLFTSSLLLSALLVMIAFNKEASAQTALSLKTVKSSKTASSMMARLSGGLTVTGVSDFKEVEASEKQTYSQYELSLGYTIDELNRFSLYAPFQKSLSQEYKEEFFADVKLSHTFKDFWRYQNFALSHTTSFVYPATENSKVNEEMYSGFELSPQIIYEIGNGVKFIYIPRYRRRFHKFTADRSGETLVNESLLQFFVTNYSFANAWAFESTLVYVKSRRYDGASVADAYLTVQELQYILNKSVSLATGIQTGGTLVNPERGQSKTIEIFDKNASEFYASASVSF